MWIRILTALVVSPVIIGLVVVGGVPLYLAIAILAMLSLYEFFNALKKKIQPLELVGYVFACLILLFNYFYKNHVNLSQGNYFLLTLSTIFLLICIVMMHERYNVISASVTLLGLMYILHFFLQIYFIRIMDKGQFLVWFLFITAWGTDTFAYFTGMLFGKNKLCPSISPKKTVEGAIGGLVGSLLLNVVYAWSLTYYLPNDFNSSFLILSVFIGIFGSILSQFGDLVASIIKRFAEIKDYGKILPGHGGVLDRFDSVIFIAPVFYMIFSFYLGGF